MRQLLIGFIVFFMVGLAGTSSTFAGVVGDVDGNNIIDLRDVVLSLSVTKGIPSFSPLKIGADVNGDNKIGMEEANYDLEVVSGIRQSQTYPETLIITLSDVNNPILVLATREDGQESLTIIGEKDAQGNITQISRLLYINGGESLDIELDTDGRPVFLTDSAGNKVSFSDYTDSTVAVTIFDSNNNPVSGPVTVEVNPDIFRISSLAKVATSYRLPPLQALNKRSTVGGQSTAADPDCVYEFQNSTTMTVLKLGAMVVSGVGCAAAIAGGITIPIAFFACGSVFLETNKALVSQLEDYQTVKIGGYLFAEFDGLECITMGDIKACISALIASGIITMDNLCPDQAPSGTQIFSKPQPQDAWLGVSSGGGDGTGYITSSPPGIECPGDCSQIFSYNQKVTLYATPETGSIFSGWSGCSGSVSCNSGSCLLTMNSDKAVIAEFKKVYNLIVGVTMSGGTVGVTSTPFRVSCGDTQGYESGSMVSLTPFPDTGFTFDGWSGACSGTGPCLITMNSDKAVMAEFKPIPPPATFTLSTTIAGTGTGTISSDPPCCTYTAGTSVTLTATPSSDSDFTGWSGACEGTGSCVVTMDEAKEVTATFTLSTVPDMFTLMVETSGSGTVSSSPSGINVNCDPICPGIYCNDICYSGINCGTFCSMEFTSGTVVTLTATPASGAALIGWFMECSGTGSCTVTMDTNHAVIALFTNERWSGTYSGTHYYYCPPNHDTYQYNNEPLSFEIQNGVLRHEGATSPIGASGQVTFGSNSNSMVFTGTINEDAGTASGTWTQHIPGTCGQAGDGNGTWSANRMLP